MVVGLFNDAFDPIMDGVGMCVRNYAHWLGRIGSLPYVVAPSIPNYSDDSEFAVLRYRSFQLPVMAPYRAGLPGLDPEFLKRVYNIPFDLVHAHCPFVSGSIALKIARRRKIPMVATFHSKYREDLRRALFFQKTTDLALSYIIRFYQATDFVWVPSKSTGHTLEDYGYEGTFEVIPNGTDLPVPSEEQYRMYRAAGRQRIEANDNEFVFLFVGQHRWEKNVRLIIEAMKILAEKSVRYRMVFAGSGYAAKEMKSLVAQYRIEGSVRFLGTIVDREEIKSLYAAADLFLFPSLYDTVGLVVLEAAAFKLPSVLAARSSAAEGIIDGENGFLTENNAARFVEKLQTVMDSPGLRRGAGQGALDTVYMSWEQVIRIVERRYQEIVEEYRGPSAGQ